MLEVFIQGKQACMKTKWFDFYAAPYILWEVALRIGCNCLAQSQLRFILLYSVLAQCLYHISIVKQR